MKETQRVVYHAEIKALKANGKVALGSELVHQDPHLTEDGLIESRGRISPYLDWNSRFLDHSSWTRPCQVGGERYT